jgi:hypothetical protein
MQETEKFRNGRQGETGRNMETGKQGKSLTESAAYDYLT